MKPDTDLAVYAGRKLTQRLTGQRTATYKILAVSGDGRHFFVQKQETVGKKTGIFASVPVTAVGLETMVIKPNITLRLFEQSLARGQ